MGIAQSQIYTGAYRSPTIGLENCGELHTNKAHTTAVSSIRGTTADPVSWLPNFYAAMVPGQGSLTLSENVNLTTNWRKPASRGAGGWVD